MAATATARSKPAARRGRSSAPARRRATQTPVGGFVPVAVGAVGGLADSGVVVRLTRSRLWIVLLGGLLIGIVALNVVALGFSASSTRSARQAEELERLNSGLRAEIVTRLSNSEIQGVAAELGLIVPEPGAIRYLRPEPGDAAEAARRLRAGDLAAGGYVAPPVDAVAPVDPAAAAVPIEPATAETAPAATPEAPAVTPEAPVTPAASAPAGGGVAAP